VQTLFVSTAGCCDSIQITHAWNGRPRSTWLGWENQ